MWTVKNVLINRDFGIRAELLRTKFPDANHFEQCPIFNV